MSGSISWKWSTIFYTSDLKSVSNKCSNSGISTLVVYLLTTSSVSSNFDVQSCNTTCFYNINYFLCSLHSSISTWFILTSFNHLTSRDSSNCFSSRNICYMNECIVFSSKYVCCSKDFLGICVLWKICWFILNFLYWTCHKQN